MDASDRGSRRPSALRTGLRAWARRHLLLAAALVLALLALGAGGGSLVACKTSFDCQGRDLPLIGGLFPGGEFAGIEQRGTGDVTLPAGFRQVVVASGLDLPTAFALLPDGRFLVAEKSGLVRVVTEQGEVLEQPFLDIRDAVNERGEGGLVHLAASPTFAEDGLVYLLYTHDDGADEADGRDTPRTVRLTRVRARGDEAEPGSEVVLLGTISEGACADHPPGADCIPMDEDSHAGGTIRFDAQGNLLVSTGDGSHADERMIEDGLRAQDLDSLAGKILRVGPDGRGLPDNPFWNGDPDAARSKVWAYGLRNPFRVSLDPRTGALLVGDVGLDTWEEVDLVERPGANLGWPCYEGPEAQPRWRVEPVCRDLVARGPGAVVAPRAWHPSGSVTGGTIVPGEAFPEPYRGGYFWGDWAGSWIRYVPRAELGAATWTARPFLENAAGPVQLEPGPNGSLLYLSLNAGELRRVVATR